tara:strand:- start:9 stop:536 length:528 start_codon:yes stop_codon:yes gene_type:complete
MSQLKVNSIVPVGGLPSGASGGIIQIVQTVKTDTMSTSGTGGSYQDITGLSVTITPSSSSNKVLIVPSILMAADSGHRHGYRILRGSTVICVGDTAGSRNPATSFQGNPPNNVMAFNHTNLFLDSPATTSATTYKVQFRGEGNSSNLFINRSQVDSDSDTHFRGTSQITAFEITV